MIDVHERLQRALDLSGFKTSNRDRFLLKDSELLSVASPDTQEGVYVYWRKKNKASLNLDEYIVYSEESDFAINADDKSYTRTANFIVRYYFRASMAETAAEREIVRSRIKSILLNLEAAGFSVPYGPSDAGDIDDIGFGVYVFDCFYSRVVG